EEHMEDAVGHWNVGSAAQSRSQVSPVRPRKVCENALDLEHAAAKDSVIDAYCGIGTISLFLAQLAKKVYGVEVVPEAIDNAKENAKLNHIENAEFVVGQAEKIMPWWSAQGLRPDVITVDPPRKGCDEALLKAMINMQPKRIVYVSCNPSTLARDLRILEDGGYKTQEVQPVDMFPQTMHVESVAWLELV